MKNAQTLTDCSLCYFNDFVVLNFRNSVQIGCYGTFCDFFETLFTFYTYKHNEKSEFT